MDNKVKSKNSKHNLERVYRDKIKYVCPVRGLVEQEVEIRRYAYLGTPDPVLYPLDIDEESEVEVTE